MPTTSSKHASDNAIGACTRCRERKIRCGRERPRCANCERENDVECTYTHMTRRVNHLKVLCQSVDRIQDRLATIETQLSQPKGPSRQEIDGLIRTSLASQPSLAPTEPNLLYGSGRGDSESDLSEQSDVVAQKYFEFHAFRRQSQHIHRLHGPSSLFVLCSRLRMRLNQPEGGHRPIDPWDTVLGTLCDSVGETTPFPPFSAGNLEPSIPRMEMLAAVERFFQGVDCVTDLFSRENFMLNIEQLYATPVAKPDQSWSACAQTVVLLALENELSSDMGHVGNKGLLASLTRSFRPSRAGVVTSHLLTTPRLINVQTLILLSVAVEHYDPSGWAEFLFSHACMLARTIGLEHTQLDPDPGASFEAIERAKVLRALYCRDKSLQAHRGALSWLSTDDVGPNAELMATAKFHAPYVHELRLALVQDSVSRVVQSRMGPGVAVLSKYDSIRTMRRVEQQLGYLAQTSRLFLCPPQHPGCDRVLALEFFGTRILAREYGSDEGSTDAQLRSDARASCCFLLLAAGSQHRGISDLLDELLSSMRTSLPNHQPQEFASYGASVHHNSPRILDAFSIPAFFILYEFMNFSANPDAHDTPAVSDLELLHGVAECFANAATDTLHNSYYRKVAEVFHQLLACARDNSTPDSRSSGHETTTLPPSGHETETEHPTGTGHPGGDDSWPGLGTSENHDSSHGGNGAGVSLSASLWSNPAWDDYIANESMRNPSLSHMFAPDVDSMSLFDSSMMDVQTMYDQGGCVENATSLMNRGVWHLNSLDESHLSDRSSKVITN